MGQAKSLPKKLRKHHPAESEWLGRGHLDLALVQGECSAVFFAETESDASKHWGKAGKLLHTKNALHPKSLFKQLKPLMKQ